MLENISKKAAIAAHGAIGKTRRNVKAESQKTRDEILERMVKETGLDRDFLLKDMEECKKKWNLTYASYEGFKFYNVPEEKREKEAEFAAIKAESRDIKREQRIYRVMDKTGWSYFKTAIVMVEARRRLNISYQEYMNWELYNVPRSKQQAIVDEERAKAEKRSNKYEERNLKKIMKATGWTREEAEAKVAAAMERTRCTMKEYFTYRFYDMTDEQQDEIFLIYHSKRLSAKYDVGPEFGAMLYNKETTNNYIKEYVKRPWCVNTKVTLEEFKETFKDVKRIIYKPISGHMGYGIEAYDINEENIEEIYNKLKDMPEAVVEKFIIQHEKMKLLSPSSVNTIRVVTVSSTKEPICPEGKYFEVAYAAVRIGSGDAVVDNFHSGGVCAVVDVNTGIIDTNAADQKGNFYEKHPTTGVAIKGFEIPYFQEAKDMIQHICEEKKIDGYLGWDVAISEDGPLLIELNVMPAAGLLTMPYIEEKRGFKKHMLRYL